MTGVQTCALPIYLRYQKLEQELGQIPVWDDRFEAVLDEMEELQEQLPKGYSPNWDVIFGICSISRSRFPLFTPL